MNRRYWTWVAGAAIIALLAAAAALGVPRALEAGALGRLRSPAPATRRGAAHWIARNGSPRCTEAVRTAVLAGELEPDVRECFVNALGNIGRAPDVEFALEVAQRDPEPYVRQAAWVAAARLDADRFRTALPPQWCELPTWDQLGVAAGLLESGSEVGLGVLLEIAERGTTDQRRVAGTALARSAWPLLEAVGRWPLAQENGLSTWTPELAGAVRERLGTIDVKRLLGERRALAASAAPIQRNMARITSTRERLARWLGVR